MFRGGSPWPTPDRIPTAASSSSPRSPTEFLNQKHTIFGQCDEPSINVVKSIARVERDPNDKPVTPVVLEKVTIVPEGQAPPPAPAVPAQPSPAPQQ